MEKGSAIVVRRRRMCLDPHSIPNINDVVKELACSQKSIVEMATGK